MDRRAAIQVLSSCVYLPMVRLGNIVTVFDLQSALDSGSSEIIVPIGVNQVTSQINWPHRIVKLVGSGIGLSILEFANGIDIGIRIYGTVLEPINGLIIRDLTIRGAENSDNAPRELIEIGDYVSNVEFSNVEFYWARKSAIRFTAGNFGSGLLIERCSIHDIATRLMIPIDGGAIQGCLHDSRIVGCNFVNTGNSSLHHGIYLTTSIALPIKNILIQNCTLDGPNTRLSSYGGLRENLRVFDNIFKANLTHFYGCDNAIVSRNVFHDCVARLASNNISFHNNNIVRINQAFNGVELILPGNLVDVRHNHFIRLITTQLCFIVVYSGEKHSIADNTFTNASPNMAIRIDSGSALQLNNILN